MKELAIAIVVFLVFAVVVSCAGEEDRSECLLRGAKLDAEAQLVNGRCYIKGWSRL